jgi:hypothetical protein
MFHAGHSIEVNLHLLIDFEDEELVTKGIHIGMFWEDGVIKNIL